MVEHSKVYLKDTLVNNYKFTYKKDMGLASHIFFICIISICCNRVFHLNYITPINSCSRLA